jgi:hypothetical protein
LNMKKELSVQYQVAESQYCLHNVRVGLQTYTFIVGTIMVD